MKKVLSVVLICLMAFAPIGCNPQSDLQKVIDQIPVGVSIINAALDFYAAYDPEGVNPQLRAEVTEYAGEVSADLQLLGKLLSDYQSSKGLVSPGKLQQMDALVAAVSDNLPKLEAAFHVSNPKTQAAIAAAVAAVNTILLELGTLLPKTPAAQAVAPRTAQIGSTGPPAKIITGKELAKKFNSAIGKDFPQAKVKA